MSLNAWLLFAGTEAVLLTNRVCGGMLVVAGTGLAFAGER